MTQRYAVTLKLLDGKSLPEIVLIQEAENPLGAIVMAIGSFQDTDLRIEFCDAKPSIEERMSNMEKLFVRLNAVIDELTAERIRNNHEAQTR
jgi:hypothetical protein